MPDDITIHGFTPDEQLPENYTSVGMILDDGDPCPGYYVHDCWHYEHRQPDGSIIVGDKVKEEVTGWFPANAFLRKRNHSSSPEKTIIKLLEEFEDYICNSDLAVPSDKPFWRQTFTPGSFSMIHTEISKHDELIHQVWNHYLETHYYPDAPQRVFLCTTYRTPKAFMLYPLSQMSRFDIYRPMKKLYTKIDLRAVRQATDELTAKPLNLLQLIGLDQKTIKVLDRQIQKKRPGLVVIETLGPPPPEEGELIPCPLQENLQQLATKHNIAVLVLATTPEL
jgi:hypothetical protein